MLDPKLTKLLKKAAGAKTANKPGADFYRKVFDAVEKCEDCLIPVRPAPERIALGPNLIRESSAQEKRILYAAPEKSLTMYRLFTLKSILEISATTIITQSRREVHSDSRLTVRSFEALAADLPDCSDFADVFVFDDMEYIEDRIRGSHIEECIACAPKNVSLIMIINPYSNIEALQSALDLIREKPVAVLDPEFEKSRIIPAFLSSEWNLLPLADNRRIANKTKRIAKDTEPFRSPRSGKTINTLASKLRDHELTPALILLKIPGHCESAVDECRKTVDQAGKALTEPRVAALLDLNPELKDHSYLPLSLAKQAAPCHEGQHPYWRELVEIFVAYGAVDIVFASPESAADLSIRFKSAVFFEIGQPQADCENWITPLQTDRIARLMSGTKTDRTALMIVPHTANIDLAYYKDLIIAPYRQLEPSFACSGASVLRLLSGGESAEKTPVNSLSWAIRPQWGRFCLQSLQNGLREELEKARCHVHILTVRSLIDLHLKLTKDINRLEYELSEKRSSGGRKSIRRSLEDAEHAMSMLPCGSCPHHDVCHKRGSKKFRGLLQAFDESADRLKMSGAGLELEFSLALEWLQEFGMIDHNRQPTTFGRLGAKTGIPFPQFLCRALKAGKIPLDDKLRKTAVLSGFLDPVAAGNPDLRDNIGESLDRAEKDYEALTPVIDSTRERLLRFGMAKPGYYLQNVVFMLEYQQTGDIDAVAGRLDISIGGAIRFLNIAKILAEVVDSFETVTVSLY